MNATPRRVSPLDEETLDNAFDFLTPEQQQVWGLVMRQGLSLQEAAEQLGLSKSAVQSRLNKAKAKVVEHLRDNKPGEEMPS
jgi:RNA polymerase sigma factor (sigma-70 family)